MRAVPERRCRPRRAAPDDEALAGVVAAVLMLAVLTGFLATVNLAWMPVWVEGAEAGHSDKLRLAVASWADSAEAHVSRNLTNRSFVHTLPVGNAGLPVTGKGASPGRASVSATPDLTVSLGTTSLRTAAGSFAASTGATKFPAQTFRYALGAMEHRQHQDTWVDPRALLHVERVAGGKVGLTLQTLSVQSPVQDVGTSGQAQALTSLASSGATSYAAGTVLLVAEGVEAPAWRTALERVLLAARLEGERLPGCAGATQAWCFDTATNDADTLDLRIFNVADGWTLVWGVVSVEVRT